MLAEERRQLILEMLLQHQRVVAKELADRFGLSVDSIRRDLTLMEEQGLLKKTYGGAVPVAKVRKLPSDESVRYGEGEPHQNAVSKMAASCIQPQDTVFIGGAGIHYGMLKYLPNDIPFTVVTNSLKIAESIRMRDNIEGYLIGGRLRSSSGGNFTDSLAIEQIGKFSLDIGFLSGGGISPSGISMARPEGASFMRAVADASRRRIGLFPHDKFGITMFARAVPIHDIDMVITDELTPSAMIEAIEKAGADVVTAPIEEGMLAPCP